MAPPRRIRGLSLALVSVGARGLASESGRLGSVEIIDRRADVLRTQFNRDAGKVRLLFILDPACVSCLQGLADLDRDLLASLPANVAVYLVYLPVIGGHQDDVSGAAGLVHAAARHFWNPDGAFGDRMGEILSLRSRGAPVYAWDVWMMYGPEAVWEEDPPLPRLLMHQLPMLAPAPNLRLLDSEAFAEATRHLAAISGSAAP